MAPFINNFATEFCLLVLLMGTSVGAFSNLFIMGIYVNDLKRKKTLKGGNKIRIALCTSNVCYSIVVFVGGIIGILLPENVPLSPPVLVYVVYYLTVFTIGSSAWLTSTLTTFYFIKVVDLKVKPMVWAKKNINVSVSWMILGVEVVALLCSVFVMLFFNSPSGSSLNTTMNSLNNSESKLVTGFVGVFLIVDCIPFLTVLGTTAYTAKILMKHNHDIMKNMGTSVTNKTKSLGNTVSKMVYILICFSMNYILLLLSYCMIVSDLVVGVWLFYLPISAFTPVQALLFIIVNPSLREALKNILKCTHCISK